MFDRRVLLAASFVLGSTASANSAKAQCHDWSALGGGMNDVVNTLAVFDDGSGPALYAGGNFTSVGGVPMNRIARWNGTSWSALGVGVDGPVTSLVVFDDGTGSALFVGGWFGNAGGSLATRVARWNGATWSPVGSGMPTGQNRVHALEIYDDGGGAALYASTGGTPACVGTTGTVRKLVAGAWTPIGDADDIISALEVHDDGSGPALYAGGYFFIVDSVLARSIAKWDGASWSAVGGGMTQGSFGFCAPVQALAVFDDGTGEALYAGGNFKNAGGVCAPSIARWDGTSWSSLGLGLSQNPSCCSTPPCQAASTVHALGVFDEGPSPELVCGGAISGVGGMSADNAVRWDGTAWSTLGTGTSSVVTAFAIFDDGLGGGPDLYAGGVFTTAGGVSANYIARWRGCGGPATHFCPGDGTTAACPCGNSGIALRGCQNSQSTGGALLQAIGTIVPDTVKLHASGELPSSLTIFLQGNATGAPGVPFGDGLRCATGILKRLYTKSASGGFVSAPTGADPSITVRSSALGDPIAAGERRYYQTYYRDPNAGFCVPPAGSTFNASSGLRIVW